LLDGLTTSKYGQEAVRANLSALQVAIEAFMTNDICGPIGFPSSPSASLQQSLESKLRQRLEGAGSTLFSLTWKSKATPAGRPYFQLVASARRISGSDCGSWPTPMAGTPAQKGYNEAGNTDSGRKTVDLCGWPTATSRDWKSSASNQHGINARPLNEVARLASWATPRVTNNGGHGSPKRAEDGRARLEDQVQGAIATGSPAPTEKRGQLNPAHSRWLMGLSSSWDRAAPSKASRG
jgi:hypothetical protein